MCFFSPFSSFNDEKLRQKYYNKSVATRDNGDVQPHDQEESKLNSTINENKSARTPTHDKIVKHAFNKNNVASIKRKQFLFIRFYSQNLQNRYNGADVMFLFKGGLPLIINKLSFSSQYSHTL